MVLTNRMAIKWETTRPRAALRKWLQASPGLHQVILEDVVQRVVPDEPSHGKVPYYTASHTNPHTTLHLNKNREDLRQRKSQTNLAVA
jgi:hypothetical protein